MKNFYIPEGICSLTHWPLWSSGNGDRDCAPCSQRICHSVVERKIYLMSGRFWQCAHDSMHKICLFPPRKDVDVGHPYHSEYLITRKCWRTQDFLWISVLLHCTTIRRHHTLNASKKTGAPGHAQEWLYLCLLSRHCLCSEDGHQSSAFYGGQRK